MEREREILGDVLMILSQGNEIHLPSIDHAHIISFMKANEREQRKFESNAL